MTIFIEISVIIVIAALVSIAMRLLRQPLIIGYIITGLLVGPYVLGFINSPETMQTFAEFGIAFLLFIVGLSLSPRVIKEVGKISLITGLGQILFTALIGFGIVRLLGFGVLPSWYIAIALTFSSTIIILKLLSDKHDLETLYGKISIGFLIFQDIVATLILILVSSVSGSSGVVVSEIFIALVTTILLTAVLIYISRTLLPKLSPFMAKSQELLFVFSLGWGLGVASLFASLGLSLEVGALIAGVALAVSPYHYEISSRMRPLRDFFIILFFVILGSQLSFLNIGAIFVPALILSLFVLVGNPLIVMILMGLLGYRSRTGFLSGLTVAQISEFSLILVALGMKNGHIGNDVLSLITLVGIITIGLSTYLILYAERIYQHLSWILSIFEKKNLIERGGRDKKYSNIIFGCNRVGMDFVESLRKKKKKFLVIDFDPVIVKELKEQGINCRYGDAEDAEFLDSLELGSVKMVISTIPDLETNRLLTEHVRGVNPDAVLILTAHHIADAHMLYDLGADYVIMPHFLGSSYASEMVITHGANKDTFAYEKKKHLAYLKDKEKHGHEHPVSEKFR